MHRCRKTKQSSLPVLDGILGVLWDRSLVFIIETETQKCKSVIRSDNNQLTSQPDSHWHAPRQGWPTRDWGPNPAHCLSLYHLQAKNNFYIFKYSRRKKIRIFCNSWKLHEFQIPGSINKVFVEHSQSDSFTDWWWLPVFCSGGAER